MTHRPGAIERAFQLAAEGKGLTEIKRQLNAEGYSDPAAQLYGPVLLTSLKRTAAAARAAMAQDAPGKEDTGKDDAGKDDAGKDDAGKHDDD
jgi:hypothetical protein